ncbi:hypothetical protein [Humisphaera borealis]|uniref:FeoB-associated Cys-rich membrane protein n=1 Tax=Humisphaera borealis TaxID=2807512 RepID=A0A7M2WUZ1_9BACT|nr:hypothetical protein [Humisphaera borealis]QOV89134.1 hypothetical protein IPV69_23415 [Humisphaera borealis]
MSPLLQHILALSIVAACLGYVGVQGYRAIRGKRSRIGNCCSKGCGGEKSAPPPSGDRIAYIPADMLRRRK